MGSLVNQAVSKRCERVRITPLPTKQDEFAEFPKDPALSGFNRSDRKFVAVCLASKLTPSVLNATDSDWWIFRNPLKRHGIKIEFLCPNDIK